MERRFKLVCVQQGSGWPSGHVAIDCYYGWPGKTGGDEMCLNYDTENPEELIREIDSLIAELKELKTQVPRRFEQWNKQFSQK